MQKSKGINRRRFLAGVAATTGPMILPSGVFGYAGRAGASSRIVTGHIGTGYRGRILLERMREHAGAVCDVDEHQLRRGAAIAGPGVRLHGDYRALLEQRDIDAVVIATPDHWHGVQAVQACEAGKDVYVETPACRTLEEARALVHAARRFGSIVQTGAPGPLTKAGRAALAHLEQGGAGAVRTVHAWGAVNPTGGDPALDTMPPEVLDWEMWLGPAREVPYNPECVHGNWRWLMDFGGGQLCHQGDHAFALALLAWGVEDLGRVQVSASGTRQLAGRWDAPRTMNVRYTFAESGRTLRWTQGEEGQPESFGVRFEGDTETFAVTRCDEQAGVPEHVTRATAELGLDGRADVVEEWFRCIQTRERPTVDIALGANAATLCILGNLAWRLGRTMNWDSAGGRFVDDPQANRLIPLAGRGPWRL